MAVGVDESGCDEFARSIDLLVDSARVTFPDVDDLFLVEYHDSVLDNSVTLSVEADHGPSLDLYSHVRFLWWMIVLRDKSGLGRVFA